MKTAQELVPSTIQFEKNEARGLSDTSGQNVLLYSKDFLEKKIVPFQQKGYELVSAKVEYIVYWYDKQDKREYKVILPCVRFEKADKKN